jgi:hypothetical protein
MKVTYNKKEYYIKHVSLDYQYALIGPHKNKNKNLYKVDLQNLEGLNNKDLKLKLKEFATMGSSI